MATSKLLEFFGVKVKGRVPLLIDNAGMWFNIRNEGVSGGTRYWDLWMHFTREMYQKGMLEPRSSLTKSTPPKSAQTSHQGYEHEGHRRLFQISQ